MIPAWVNDLVAVVLGVGLPLFIIVAAFWREVVR
jgi:hypothetical protein